MAYSESNPLGVASIELGAGDTVQVSSTKWEPPQVEEYAILVGEVAHSLRSALDTTVWSIVKQTYRGDFEAIERALMFPITLRDAKNLGLRSPETNSKALLRRLSIGLDTCSLQSTGPDIWFPCSRYSRKSTTPTSTVFQ